MHQRLIRSQLGIYTDPRFAAHETGPMHPERPARIDAALEGARRAGLNDRILGHGFDHPETDRIIAKVHSSDYERELEAAVERGARYFHSLDNPISRGTPAAARAAVSAALAAADRIWIEHSLERAFLVARPPGHHAERSQAMGFCFFNTIACAAEYLLEQPAIDRVFVVDWDVHHGNGTQHLFEDRADVFYASIHRFPFYPGTGSADEIGTGAGEGATLNIPMEGGAGDADYLRLFEQRIVPAIRDHAPQALLISSGFDAHRSDPLGGMRVHEETFAEMTRRLTEVADDLCGGRILSLLEGGYDLEGLARCTAAHLTALGEE
ncbi:MAG TPA: histone deacetylase [Thermoanaerobaculia bacterium]|nr:histone deacetylase [Thermoanaerobaculia bacterium]